MRLVRLSVDRFQCIERAELELGPGLNVLYGPNDLGKSSLAWAIRAVLLLQHSSAAHGDFVSWYGGGVPRVTLTLCDDEERFWRVTKAFSSGSGGTSILESSKDGREPFVREATGRPVDEKLRSLLRWGVPSSGRGLSESFLTQVLLAEQDDVRKILFNSSLAADADSSGRIRLTEALGALAQDPLFKKVLDEAQACADRAFTPTGRKKRGAGSPFLDIQTRLNELEAQREGLLDKVRETELAETRIQIGIDRRGEAQQSLDDARRNLAEAQNRRAEQIRAAEAAVQQREAEREAARRDLDALMQDGTDFERRAEDLEEERKTAQEELNAAESAVQRAAEDLSRARVAAEEVATAVAAAEQAAKDRTQEEAAAAVAEEAAERCDREHQQAEQRLREATSGEAVHARELRAKELENRGLTLASRRTETERALESVRAVGRAVESADAAKAARDAQMREVKSAHQAVRHAQQEIAELDAARASQAQLERFGRLRQARESLAAAERSAQRAEEDRAESARLSEAAATLRARVRPDLPSLEEIAALRRLSEDLRVAEARLGGGLTVQLRPARSLTVRTTRDGAPDAERMIAEPAALAAERSLTLAIEDLIEIEITAGEEAARNEAAALRDRWHREAEPVLERLKVGTVEEIAVLRRNADDLLRQAEANDRDAAQAAERAAGHATVDGTPLREQIAALEADLRGAEERDLAAQLIALGDRWQQALAERAADLTRRRDEAQRALDREREQLTRAETRLESLNADAAAKLHESTRRQKELPAPWSEIAAQHEADLAAIRSDLLETEEQRNLLTGAGTQEEDAARAALEAAEIALAAARAEREEAQRRAQAARDRAVEETTRRDDALTRARRLDGDGHWSEALQSSSPSLRTDAWREALQQAERARDEKKSRHKQAGERLDDLKRERTGALEKARTALQEAEDRLRIAREHLTASPEADLTEAQSEVDRRAADLRQAEDELTKARGALEHVGGAIVRERREELDKAIEQAKERWHEIEVEYDAWKLLADTLKSVESEAGAHLGRALAGPVSERFQALTGGRYGRLELGPDLKTEGLHVADAVRDVGALSAGTQDQLATLLRLCIAEQLRSAIVLDDHLTHGDPDRVAWFNDILRTSAHQLQIVLITCRPAELLRPEELPTGEETTHTTSSGLVHAVDLAQVIRRF
jgi:hypothetical protein